MKQKITLEDILNTDYKNLSYLELSKLLNVDMSTIRKKLIKNGIYKPPIHSTYRDKKKTIMYFAQQGLTASKIAKEVNLTPRQVTVYCNKQKIKLVRSVEIVPTYVENQVILGSILGDGHIGIMRKTKNCRLVLKHCMQQLEYLEYKYKLLNRLSKGIKIYNRHDDRFKTPDYQTCVLETTTNMCFRHYRDGWYSIKKIVSDKIYEVEGLGLAIWAMDDGMKALNTIILCTEGFGKSGVEIIKDFLYNKYKIESIIQSNNNLRIKTKTYPIFYNLIKEYIIPSMCYKFPIP